jgi:hypothetical protein
VRLDGPGQLEEAVAALIGTDGKIPQWGELHDPAVQRQPQLWLRLWAETRGPDEFAQRVVSAPVVAAETSPLHGARLGDLASIAAAAGVYVFGGQPLIAVLGGGIGLVAVRAVGAVAGALWEGARPEVVELGRDAAAAYVAAIRSRLGIERPSDD